MLHHFPDKLVSVGYGGGECRPHKALVATDPAQLFLDCLHGIARIGIPNGLPVDPGKSPLSFTVAALTQRG